jgi:hypothetical protein
VQVSVYTVRSESSCVLITFVGSDVHECLYGLNPFNFIRKHFADLRSESRCALIEGVGSDVHERLYRPEPV